ncbi:putative phage DNA-packaging protein B [Weissella oryzae SG25]|uniref:Putative phage DNA-packaging protein B n=1 Tax=Weissella oryzae (strain DSM 25784 / JCM 18191 / LMG 30913 / SG25) TaxID=1329250 RepID=A0A069CWX9_WEIOS|nr:hypothetical protein [Weissella oryzae]GAK31984.1 putative phage DNA-packaging protein B [Weissella oryzae SG25]
MTPESLLSSVKVALRTTTLDEDLDAEILMLIKSAMSDLKVNGIVSDRFILAEKDLVTNAIILYVKAHWGYDNPDAARQLSTYELLKTNLSIHSQYGG